MNSIKNAKTSTLVRKNAKFAPKKAAPQKVVNPYVIPKDLLEFVQDLLRRTDICDYIADHHAPVDWPLKFARALVEMTNLQADEKVSSRGHVVWDTFVFDDDEETALSGFICVWKALKGKGLLDLPIETRKKLSLVVDVAEGTISVGCPSGPVLESLKAQYALEKERAAYRELYVKFNGENPLK